MKGVWKYVSIISGDLSVMTGGTRERLELCADNLVLHTDSKML